MGKRDIWWIYIVVKLRVVVSKRGNFKVKKLDSGTRVGQFLLPTPLRGELGLTPIIKIGCPTCYNVEIDIGELSNTQPIKYCIPLLNTTRKQW